MYPHQKKYLLISKNQIAHLEVLLEDLQCFIESCKYKPELSIDVEEQSKVKLPEIPTEEELINLF